MPASTHNLGFVGVVPVNQDTARRPLDLTAQLPTRATANAGAEIVLTRISQPGGANNRVALVVCEVLFAGDVTGHATNYVTLKLYNRGSDGTGTDVLASKALSTAGTYGKYVALTLTIDASKAFPKDGDVLSFAIEVTSSGQTTPNGHVRLRVAG